MVWCDANDVRQFHVAYRDKSETFLGVSKSDARTMLERLGLKPESTIATFATRPADHYTPSPTKDTTELILFDGGRTVYTMDGRTIGVLELVDVDTKGSDPSTVKETRGSSNVLVSSAHGAHWVENSPASRAVQIRRKMIEDGLLTRRDTAFRARPHESPAWRVVRWSLDTSLDRLSHRIFRQIPQWIDLLRDNKVDVPPKGNASVKESSRVSTERETPQPSYEEVMGAGPSSSVNRQGKCD